LQVVPWGFRKLLNWIAKEYNNPPVMITENGFSDRGELNDRDRVDYLIVSGSNFLDVCLRLFNILYGKPFTGILQSHFYEIVDLNRRDYVIMCFDFLEFGVKYVRCHRIIIGYACSVMIAFT